MNKKEINPQTLYEKLKSYKHTSYDYTEQASIFSDTPQEIVKVQLRPKESMDRGLFWPDPLIPGGYIAHPVTIRAVRKDIFMAGEEFIDLEVLYQCYSCKKEIDLQFWHFCPYCESQFPKNLEIINNRAHY